jgi:hypothetical protein
MSSTRVTVDSGGEPTDQRLNLRFGSSQIGGDASRAGLTFIRRVKAEVALVRSACDRLVGRRQRI